MQIYLNTYGTYLHVKDEMFEIKVPSKDAVPSKQHIAAHKISSIIMSTSASLSTDAVRLALMNNIDIIFTHSDGHPMGRIWHSKLGSTTRIRKRQLEASLSIEAVKFTKLWIGEKINNQLEFIKDLKKHRPQMADYLNDKIARIENLHLSLNNLQADKIELLADTIRGLEGTAGRLYFETISYVLPPQYQYSGRSMRPARDAFNVLLNYGFGILYSRVEKCLMIAGLDPYVGFLHRDDYNQKSMVFDFIEPYRIFVETTVFRLCSAKKVNKAHTDGITNGITLNKEGKELLVTALNNYMEVETIRYKGRNQTRANAMQQDAHTFANELIKYDSLGTL
ncbi:CRISPR-associated endonuclease Cas1 [Chitinophaga oryziterrae]|uniref:CRISPR-associated endonuclease Cas1 n=1 Tax=Chitinophaga oryziterrae TaxID=1031224 RepID=A0A6N8JLZ6_9BACT|nr:CRISPR-associated endonuclease Cas1 [Chitinophaga oryziterrae]MVT45192.1 CRISPR-associated endonuclease Cas1 [Chitinophaga oryziterrae]